MAQRPLLTTNQLYESVIVLFQQYADELHKYHISQGITHRDEEWYKHQCAEIKRAHHDIWREAIRRNECFHFGHPIHGSDPHGEKGKLMLAEALNEDPWWIQHELSHFKLNINKPTCESEGCMNPLHWPLRNIRGTGYAPNIKGVQNLKITTA